MASDNRLLRSRKHRYQVRLSETDEIVKEGFTSMKAATQWAKGNIKTKWYLYSYSL